MRPMASLTISLQLVPGRMSLCGCVGNGQSSGESMRNRLQCMRRVRCETFCETLKDFPRQMPGRGIQCWAREADDPDSKFPVKSNYFFWATQLPMEENSYIVGMIDWVYMLICWNEDGKLIRGRNLYLENFLRNVKQSVEAFFDLYLDICF